MVYHFVVVVALRKAKKDYVKNSEKTISMKSTEVHARTQVQLQLYTAKFHGRYAGQHNYGSMSIYIYIPL